ncbi:potassium/proton antiporter [Henriciella sp.]|uniref:potassium/proton antiporter n=1 Tax=Henriciella sp. TaxID=1968823 RepID=UPI00262AC7A2|nr:potassium/proton antiporter [Henriciella sp.]
MYQALFLISILVLVSLAFFPLARRSGTPMLLVVLAVGMLAGEDGPGGVAFSDFELAYNAGSVALALILFAGGLETGRDVLRRAGLPAIVLALPGVLITAGIVGVAAHFLLGLPLLLALLLGAVVAPTDAAATFMLIQHGKLNIPDRTRSTLLLESGFNDPAGICLTIILTALIGAPTAADPAMWAEYGWLVAAQIVFGIAGGIVGGRLLSALMNRLTMPTGTYPVLAIAGALVIFAGITLIGGSGFLAVYIAGIALRNRLKGPLEPVANFSEGMQWLSQLLLFLLLGFLVTPSELPDEIIGALICAGLLTFVARPVAVWLGLAPFGYRPKELTFLSWVGLRGAVPILLSIYPVVSPGPVTHEFFNVVFIIVVSSLIVQGFTAGALGRLLKLQPD